MAPQINNNSLSLFFLVIYLFLHSVNAGSGDSYSPPNEAAACLVVVPKAAPDEAPNDEISHLLFKYNALSVFHQFTVSKPNRPTGAAKQLSQTEFDAKDRLFSCLLLQTLHKKNISHLSAEGDAELPAFI